MNPGTCVVLAAGRAVRMGGGKLLLPFGKGTVLDAVLDSCAARPIVVVASPELAEHLKASGAELTVVVNDAPERGMAHSLRLANQAVEPDRPIAVLLGDKPLVTRELIARMMAALESGIDVAFPQRGGVPGHPVVLSPHARTLLDALGDGDTLHLLRDDPRLTRRSVAIDHEGAYVDIDTEADYRRVARRDG
jgi:molybdenum cofactor cytidylyltransferase